MGASAGETAPGLAGAAAKGLSHRCIRAAAFCCCPGATYLAKRAKAQLSGSSAARCSGVASGSLGPAAQALKPRRIQTLLLLLQFPTHLPGPQRSGRAAVAQLLQQTCSNRAAAAELQQQSRSRRAAAAEQQQQISSRMGPTCEEASESLQLVLLQGTDEAPLGPPGAPKAARPVGQLPHFGGPQGPQRGPIIFES